LDSIKLLFSGDFFGGRRLTPLIYDLNYKQLFGELLPEISDCDFASINLESPILSEGRKLPKTGPNIKAAPETIEVLKLSSFNLACLSNNHILDYGEDGLHNTIKLLKEKEIDYVGVGNDLKDSRIVLYKKIKNKRFAFLNFSENEWAAATDARAGANPVNIIDNSNDIRKAKKNADYVIVQYHGGNEHYSLPSPRIKKIFRFYVDSGADIVLCHHSHYFSGYEEYSNSCIFYGLGNILFDNYKGYSDPWNWGISVKLTFNNLKISHEIVPHRQDDKVFGIRLLSDKERDTFNNKLQNLNNIISNDDLLEDHFNDFVKKKEKQYWDYLKPYSSRVLNYLFRKGLLPTFISKSKQMLLLNLVRCEAHRDVVLKILDKNNK